MSSDIANYPQILHAMETSVRHVKMLLQAQRDLVLPHEQVHSYEDKFLLMESVANCTLARMLVILRELGLTDELCKQGAELAKSAPVRMKAIVHEECEYLREELKSSDFPITKVVEVTINNQESPSFHKETNIVQKIQSYYWRVKKTISLSLVAGFQGSVGECPLTQRSIEYELTTRTKHNPRESWTRDPVRSFEVDVSYLFQVCPERVPSFRIDRSALSTYTPTFNQNVQDYQKFADEWLKWCSQWRDLVNSSLIAIEMEKSSVDMRSVWKHILESCPPVLPLLDRTSADQVALLSIRDFQDFVDACQQCLQSSLATGLLNLSSPAARSYFGLSTVIEFLSLGAQDFLSSLNYIRGLTAQQLVDAIGKIVTSKDIYEFNIFHNRKIFQQAYQPKPFSFDVRRPGFTPEGVVSIDFCFEEDRKESSKQIFTIQNTLSDPQPLALDLSPSNRVILSGSQYLHGYLAHQFSTEKSPTYKLTARARPFCCFLMLIGTIGPNNTFLCKNGLLVKDKEEWVIPLLLETIPSVQEFRDAISSLSPEQQRFAKAFREVQMASTVFAIVIVQVKPQLEKVLNIPADGLTKEIQLTQVLLELFIEHQIPSDLISYVGPENAPLAQKLEEIKNHVSCVKKILSDAKNEQMQERMKEAELAHAEGAHTSYLKNSAVYGGLRFGASPAFNSERTTGFGMKPLEGFAPAPSTSATRNDTTTFSKSNAFRSAPTVEVTADAPSPLPLSSSTDSNPESFVLLEDLESEILSLPKKIEDNFDRLDPESNLRLTKVKLQNVWRLCKQDKVTRKSSWTTLSSAEEKDAQKHHALDLLDALTRSGELPVQDCGVHVFFASSQCFDETVFNTVVCKNVHPMEQMERSALILASTIHGVPVPMMVNHREKNRIAGFSPKLFETME